MVNKELVWSSYQTAIFEDVKSQRHNLLIDAKAGSGKTRTLLESLKYIPASKKILVVAFNKKIAIELQERSPNYSNVDICTLHSFGYKMIRQSFGNAKLDTEKAFKIVKKLLEPLKKFPKDKDDFDTIFEMKKCISLCKGAIVDVPNSIDQLMDDFDISSGSLDRDVFIQKVIVALGECKKNKAEVDFDDMISFCIVHNLPIDQYDYVLCDEIQDLNNAQNRLSFSACKKDGRIIAFGDSYQVLYSWRGSDILGLESLKKKLDAKVLDLPISYRCPKKVVFEAQKFVPAIKYSPDAKDGNVISILEKEIVGFVKPNDFVLSRTNAPLVKLCFSLWRNKIPASMKGKDLGPALIGLITQSKKKTVKSFVEWINKWADDEIKRLKGKNRKATTVIDRLECLVFLAEGKKSIAELISTVKSLFENKDERGVVQLMTIHGSKGLESDRVFILMKTLIFGDSQEEKNCEYVAITRAKTSLFYVR